MEVLVNTSPTPVCTLCAVCVLNVPQASESGKKPEFTIPFAFIERTILSLSWGAVGLEELTHYLLLFGSIIGKGLEGRWVALLFRNSDLSEP